MFSMKLVRPSWAYAGDILVMRKEMLVDEDSNFAGCAGLEDIDDFGEWMAFEARLKIKFGDKYVPSEVFLALVERRLVGVVDYRHPLTDYLKETGGSIGCSVRPSERGKGYGTEILKQILQICRGYDEDRVLLACDQSNLASQKIILKNGGVLEDTIVDKHNLTKSGIIEHYWIDLNET